MPTTTTTTTTLTIASPAQDRTIRHDNPQADAPAHSGDAAPGRDATTAPDAKASGPTPSWCCWRIPTTPSTPPEGDGRSLSGRQIGVWGTAARAVFGGGLLALALVDGVGFHTLVVAGLLTAGLVAVQLARAQRTGEDLQMIDPVAFYLHIAVFALLVSFDLTRSGLLVFYGLSALVAAARRQPGCEVTAVSNWLLRRNDQIGCPLFDPLDTLEAKRRTAA